MQIIERGFWELEPTTSEVDISQWKRSKEALFTTNVSTCVVLAAHNSRTNEGLMGHFSVISPLDDYAHVGDQKLFDQAVWTIESLGPATATEVWLSGARDYENIELDRDYTEKKWPNYASVREFLKNQ